MLNGAAFVVPNGRRYFVVRMSSREDDVEQLQGWVRDLVIHERALPRGDPLIAAGATPPGV